MANVGPGGGAAAGAGFGGEEDVPDIRFLTGLRKIDVGNRSKEWLGGNQNSPFKHDITFEQKEALFIDYMKSEGFGKEELKINYEVPVTSRQNPLIDGMNGHACVMMGGLGRKRRHYLFLLMMLVFGAKYAAKLAKSNNSLLPQKYRSVDQIRGDMKSVQDGYNTLCEQIHEVFAQVVNAGGRPMKFPDVFGKSFELPNPRGLSKSKKKKK